MTSTTSRSNHPRRRAIQVDEAGSADLSRYFVVMALVAVTGFVLTTFWDPCVGAVIGLTVIFGTLDWWRGAPR